MGSCYIQRILHFLDSGWMADTSIYLANSEEISAHSQFLLAVSDIFLPILIKETKETVVHYRIDCPTYSAIDFGEILKYIYSGTCSSDISYAVSYIRAGTEFGIPGLEDEGKKILKENLNQDHALTVFRSAREFGYSELGNVCLKFICSHGAKIIQQNEFLQLNAENLIEIVTKDRLHVDEAELFLALLRWSAEEYRRTHEGCEIETSNDKRTVLNFILPHIRFPLMSPTEFARIVAPTKILTHDEGMELFSYFLVKPEERSLLPSGHFSCEPRSYCKKVEISNSCGALPHESKAKLRLTIGIVGESAVGKTSFNHRFSNGKFDDQTHATIGMEFGLKTICLNEQIIRIEIWDTSGQEGFQELRKQQIRSVDGVIVMFDSSRRSTFESLEEWMEVARSADPSRPVLLCASKIDRDEDENTTSYETASTYAKKHSIPYIETSAKNNINVNEAIEGIVRLVLTRIEAMRIDQPDGTIPENVTLDKKKTTGSYLQILRSKYGKLKREGCACPSSVQSSWQPRQCPQYLTHHCRPPSKVCHMYFVSFILQFQVHQALCQEAGEYEPGYPEKPLHEGDIYEYCWLIYCWKKMQKIFESGMSKNWEDLLKNVICQRKMSAGPIKEYFRPLTKFLIQQRETQSYNKRRRTNAYEEYFQP